MIIAGAPVSVMAAGGGRGMKATLRVYSVFAVLAVVVAGAAVATAVIPTSSDFTQTEALARADAAALVDAHETGQVEVSEKLLRKARRAVRR
jgi:hypothetical protein